MSRTSRSSSVSSSSRSSGSDQSKAAFAEPCLHRLGHRHSRAGFHARGFARIIADAGAPDSGWTSVARLRLYLELFKQYTHTKLITLDRSKRLFLPLTAPFATLSPQPASSTIVRLLNQAIRGVKHARSELRHLHPRRLAVLAGAILLPAAALADGEVNLYTTREPGLIEPLLDAFTEETGIKVNTRLRQGRPARARRRRRRQLAGRRADDGRHRQPGRSRRQGRHPADQVRGARSGDPGATSATRTATGSRCRCAPASSTSTKDLDLDDLHLRGARRPEVEGQGLHPLGPASLQHRAVRRLSSPSTARPSDRGHGSTASRPTSPARPAAATATSPATSSAASATSARPIPTMSA